ncbi:MAG: transporter [Tannerella sp.]|jgi:BASS family bile acid:Na+ symporter|nr:transporter [Tannerella sp.]
MLKFIKDWILPIAMIIGALTHSWIYRLAFLMPYLIFAMLLLTFCKITLKDIRFHRAHIWLLLIQLGGSIGVYLLLRSYNEIMAQAAMLCILMPTATAAAVITGMLGGNVGFLTAYVFFCNIAVAIAAPFYFALTGAHAELSFFQSVWIICQKVFPLLILPLIITLIFQARAPKVHKILLSISQMSFYLWVAALMIVTGVSVNFMLNRNQTNDNMEWKLFAISLIICCLQFYIGRLIGRRYGDPISSGQGLGQKNTILAIWMAQTYLHPLTILAPTGYILWQNIINSWQLYLKGKKK